MGVRRKIHGETDKMKLITAILRTLHPDTNGGDHSRTEEFQAAIREHRIHNRVCACGCGKLVDPARMRLNPKTKLAGQFCKGRYVGNLRRKPRKLAVALGLLCAFLSISCSSLKTNSAAFNAGMAQARANVIALTMTNASDSINPMLAGLLQGTAPATNALVTVTAPLPPGTSIYLPDFIYPPNWTNLACTLQRSTDLKTWSNYMAFAKSTTRGGTLAIHSTNPFEFYRLSFK